MKLKDIFRLNEESNPFQTKRYKWTAMKDGKEIKSGVRELTVHEMQDQFRTSDLQKLIDKWNTQGAVNGIKSNGLTWKYEML